MSFIVLDFKCKHCGKEELDVWLKRSEVEEKRPVCCKEKMDKMLMAPNVVVKFKDRGPNL